MRRGFPDRQPTASHVTRRGGPSRARRRGPLAGLRLLSLLLATWAALSHAAAGLADARMGERVSVPHVEDASSTSCPRQHLDDCALCRHAAAGAGVLGCPYVAAPAAPCRVAPRAARHRAPSAAAGHLPAARAPPAP